MKYLLNFILYHQIPEHHSPHMTGNKPLCAKLYIFGDSLNRDIIRWSIGVAIQNEYFLNREQYSLRHVVSNDAQ
jgi:hypothetical protein